MTSKITVTVMMMVMVIMLEIIAVLMIKRMMALMKIVEEGLGWKWL